MKQDVDQEYLPALNHIISSVLKQPALYQIVVHWTDFNNHTYRKTTVLLFTTLMEVNSAH